MRRDKRCMLGGSQPESKRKKGGRVEGRRKLDRTVARMDRASIPKNAWTMEQEAMGSTAKQHTDREEAQKAFGPPTVVYQEVGKGSKVPIVDLGHLHGCMGR